MDYTIYFPVLLLVLLNVVAFACIDIDKRQARRGGFRIPELMLLMLAAIGGTIGIYGGCIMYRHKVHKRGFTMALHLILLLQILAALLVFARS
jgi:uncharacterized membrane protein YsdA (DUF1294 family)